MLYNGRISLLEFTTSHPKLSIDVLALRLLKRCSVILQSVIFVRAFQTLHFILENLSFCC